MKEQREKSALVEFKEESVTLRNAMEAAKSPDTKRSLRFRLKSAKFWERLMEGLIFILLLIIISGCRSTILGTGQVLQGIGQGTGTIVTGVGNYLVEEGQE